MIPTKLRLCAVAIGTAALLAAGCGSSQPTAASSSHASASSSPSTAATQTAAPRTIASSQPGTVAIPDTPAGAQAKWLLGAPVPIPEAQLKAHFDSALLALGAQLNEGLESAGELLVGPGPIRFVSIEVNQPDLLVGAISAASTPQLTVTLAVNAQGLVSGLYFKPVLPPAPKSWAGVEAAVRSAAPRVRMLVAQTTGGSCKTIKAIDPTVPSPLGSLFKLYVLDALGTAIESGKASWNQQLTVTAGLKALPSGVLQDEPDGTKVSVKVTADKMISLSDNTGADMVIHLVGRPAVEAALTQTGMADPALDEPFLTPRELFILKLEHWPSLANEYAAASESARRKLLASVVDPAALPALADASGWVKPREIDKIEWFASPEDICRAYNSLQAIARRPGLAPLAGALEINDGSLQLPRSQWPTIWFKGGSEPGVLTLTYLATTRSGRSYFVGVLTSDPSAPLGGQATLTLISAITGAFTLAAQQG